MPDSSFELQLAKSDRMAAVRAAARLANALQDIFNDIGELPEVRVRYESVQHDVEEFAGLEHADD